jgi:hypothetical protein
LKINNPYAYECLKEYAQRMNYKPGWAYHIAVAKGYIDEGAEKMSKKKDRAIIDGKEYYLTPVPENKQTNIFETEKPPTNYDRVAWGEQFYFIGISGELHNDKETNHSSDDKLFKAHNYARTEDALKLQQIQFRLNLALQRYADLNNKQAISWEDITQTKYSIIFIKTNTATKTYWGPTVTCTTAAIYPSQVYFTDRRIAEKAIKEFASLFKELTDYYLLDMQRG